MEDLICRKFQKKKKEKKPDLQLFKLAGKGQKDVDCYLEQTKRLKKSYQPRTLKSYF